MLRAFWTWDPVSSGKAGTFGEPDAHTDNKWFFDKSVNSGRSKCQREIFMERGWCSHHRIIDSKFD